MGSAAHVRGNQLRCGVRGGDPGKAGRHPVSPACYGERPLPHAGQRQHRPAHRGDQERLRAARTRHGGYGQEARELRELIRMLKARAKRPADPA